jgi:hypothetical protein
LRATFDWSYELLAEPERVILRRLAIFAGAFRLEAASAVVASPELAQSEVVEGPSNLVAKSLVAAEVDGRIARYRLLDTTRAYAIEKLGESGEGERLARRHAEYDEAGQPSIRGQAVDAARRVVHAGLPLVGERQGCRLQRRRACVWCRGSAVRRPPVNSWKRSSRRAASASMPNTAARAAASSIASGMPSSRRQIAAIANAACRSSETWAPLARDRRTNSQTAPYRQTSSPSAAGTASGGTG